jgi:glutaredoxin-like protein NrdH
MITVYSKPSCPHCVQAKNFLDQNGILYTSIDVTENAAALAFVREQGHKTVPQLYVKDTLLVEGGNSALQKLTKEEVLRRVGVILG